METGVHFGLVVIEVSPFLGRRDLHASRPNNSSPCIQSGRRGEAGC